MKRIPTTEGGRPGGGAGYFTVLAEPTRVGLPMLSVRRRQPGWPAASAIAALPPVIAGEDAASAVSGESFAVRSVAAEKKDGTGRNEVVANFAPWNGGPLPRVASTVRRDDLSNAETLRPERSALEAVGPVAVAEAKRAGEGRPNTSASANLREVFEAATSREPADFEVSVTRRLVEHADAVMEADASRVAFSKTSAEAIAEPQRAESRAERSVRAQAIAEDRLEKGNSHKERAEVPDADRARATQESSKQEVPQRNPGLQAVPAERTPRAAQRERGSRRVNIGTVEVRTLTPRAAFPTPLPPTLHQAAVPAPMAAAQTGGGAGSSGLSRGLCWRYGLVQG